MPARLPTRAIRQQVCTGTERLPYRAGSILREESSKWSPGYHAQGKYGSMFPKVAGKLWVDKQDLGWIKVEGQVIHPFSMGLFLVRLLRGSHINMQQTRVNDGIWMPERVEVQAIAKIFFVKSLSIDRVMVFSDYKLPQTSAPQ